MGEAALRRMTVDEFLVWDGEGDRRYELIGGEIVAMTPPLLFHTAITMKIGAALQRRLKPPCQVLGEAGIRLPWRNDTYYQADLAVTCSPLKQGEWGTPDPIIIIEVLSPSTAAHDRVHKLPDYRRIESVQEILIVASDEKHIEHWRRGDGAWTARELEAADRLEIGTFGFDIPVEALYEGLDFSQGAAAQS
jgi:Uma2 family endonuclease